MRATRPTTLRRFGVLQRTSCNLCRVDVEPQLAYQKDGFDVVRCPSCGLLFRASMPSSDELIEIYSSGYFRDDHGQPDRAGYADYLADAAAHRRNARRRLRMLSACCGTPGRLLDVGCGAGFFVAEAQDRGWDAEGIDVSEEMVSWGREHVAEKLTATPFSRFELPPASLRGVTMWDYIEHSLDARADIEHAHAILEPDGVLALSTGDVDSLFARLSGKRWHLLTPHHHNYFFGRTTLMRLLVQGGFEIVRTAHDAAWYSAEHLLYKLGSLVPAGTGRAASHRLRRTRLRDLEVPVNLFDIVTILARKRAAA